MKIKFPYKCDECGVQKGESNCWWLRRTRQSEFLLTPWDDVQADLDGYEHICSESCAGKALSKWMTEVAGKEVHRAEKVGA